MLDSYYLYLIIILLLLVYIFILQHKVSKLEGKLSSLMVSSIDFKLEDEIMAMLEQGKSNVEIIKFVRQATGLGLLQAKLYVDRIDNNHRSE